MLNKKDKDYEEIWDEDINHSPGSYIADDLYEHQEEKEIRILSKKETIYGCVISVIGIFVVASILGILKATHPLLFELLDKSTIPYSVHWINTLICAGSIISLVTFAGFLMYGITALHYKTVI